MAFKSSAFSNYIEARFYDPDFGRFLQVDPAREFWNSYSYVGNNPVMGVDPDGKMEIQALSPFHGSLYEDKLTDVKYYVKFDTIWTDFAVKSPLMKTITFAVDRRGWYTGLKWILAVQRESKRFLSGTRRLPYGNLKGIPGSENITGWVDQAKFETNVRDNMEDMFGLAKAGGKNLIVLTEKTRPQLGAAIYATLAIMEGNHELPSGSTEDIMKAWSVNDLFDEAKTDDKFWKDVEGYINHKIKSKVRNKIHEKVYDSH